VDARNSIINKNSSRERKFGCAGSLPTSGVQDYARDRVHLDGKTIDLAARAVRRGPNNSINVDGNGIVALSDRTIRTGCFTKAILEEVWNLRVDTDTELSIIL